MTNEDLYWDLIAGRPPELVWSTHAKDRARELVAQCIPVAHIDRAVSSPEMVYWSDKYERPLSKYGDAAVAYQAGDDGVAVIVTCLPSSQEAWDRVAATGLQGEGREYREDCFS